MICPFPYVGRRIEMKIPIAAPQLGREEEDAVLGVLHSGVFVQGPRVEEFEAKFAAFVGSNYGVAVTNGTVALYLALLAHAIKPGDRVIIPSFSFIATGNAVLMAGATPVFADIVPGSFTIDFRHVQALLETDTERTIKAVMPVHLYGQPASIGTYHTLTAGGHQPILIGDACQAHGAEWYSKPIGTTHTCCWSFYPTKNMTVGGEGGMVTTNDSVVADRLQLLRNHGMRRRYDHETFGGNFRLGEMEAAIGLVQLEKLPDWNNQRRAWAAQYRENLHDLPGIHLPNQSSLTRHVYHQYTIRVTEWCPITRDTLQERLAEAGIGTGIYYPVPIHRQASFQGITGADVDLPETDRAAREVLSLPVHPKLIETDFGKIIFEVRRAVLG